MRRVGGQVGVVRSLHAPRRTCCHRGCVCSGRAAALPPTAAERVGAGCVSAGHLAVAGGGLHGVPEWQWGRGAGRTWPNQ